MEFLFVECFRADFHQHAFQSLLRFWFSDALYIAFHLRIIYSKDDVANRWTNDRNNGSIQSFETKNPVLHSMMQNPGGGPYRPVAVL